MTLIAFALLAQAYLQGLPGHTLAVDDTLALVTESGQASLQLGEDCWAIVPDQDVLVFPGSAGLATLAPAEDPESLCHVFIGALE